MRIKRLILLLSSALFLSGCTLPFAGKKAGLQITANPAASVFLDNKSLGQTPVYQEGLKPGTYALKITGSDTTLAPFEGKITLNSGSVTVVDRQLTADVSKAHGYILTFETLSNKTATEINLISFPDRVSVMIDGAPVGFTPFKSDSITAGPHIFTLASPGYEDLVIRASAQSGHRLVINAQLGVQMIVPAPTPEATPSAAPTTTPKPSVDITPLPKQATDAAVLKPYVEISSTPTGWLKVRATADSNGQELAKVNPGDKFPYFATSGSWFQIEYLTGKKGWVSSTYAKLVN